MATLKNRFQVFIVMALILVSTPSCFNNKKISNALKDEIRDSLKVELQKFFDNQSSEDEVAQKLRRKRAIFNEWRAVHEQNRGRASEAPVPVSSQVISDTGISQLNACVERPDFGEISCYGTDREIADQVEIKLLVCDKDLTLERYSDCQTQLIVLFSSLQENQCKDVFTDHVRCLIKKNILKKVTNLIHPEVGPLVKKKGRINKKDLGQFLADFGSWYRDTLQPIYQNPSLARVKSEGMTLDPLIDEERQKNLLLQKLADQDQQEILDAFWAAIAANSQSDEISKERIDFYDQNQASFQVAEKVILQEGYPIPLLMKLLGDSLKVLSDRIHFLASIADLGSSIHSRKESNNTELFKIISLLGSLGSDLEFQKVKDYIAQINIPLAHPLREFFYAAIKENFTKFLEDYYQNLSHCPEAWDVLQLNPLSVPRFAQGLLEIIQSNRILRNAYQASGFYSCMRDAETTLNFSPTLESDLIKRTAMSEGAFQEKWEQLKKNRKEHHHEILEESGEQTFKRLKDENKRKTEKIIEITKDINRLRLNLFDIGKKTTDYLAGFFAVLSSEFRGNDSELPLENRVSLFTIAPKDALTDPHLSTLEDSVFKNKPIQLTKGMIASIKLKGNWSPTCALRKSNFVPPIPNLLIGPEGFMMSISQSKARIHSVEDYQRGVSITHKYTGSAFFYKTNQSTANWFDQDSTMQCFESYFGLSNGKIDAFETRQQAAFNLGIRSSFAPFQHFPVGSLLIAQVKKEGRSLDSILSIEVAQRANQILAQDDVDLYLIVNDCNDADNGAEELEVSVEIKKFQEGSIASQVPIVTADIVNHIDQKLDRILLQGDVSSEEINTLRNEISKKLQQADWIERSRATAGPVIPEFWKFWVENQLLSAEKKSRIRRLERNLKIELSKLGRVKYDIEHIEQTSRLKNSQSKVYVIDEDSLDIEQFTAELNPVVDKLKKYIIPLVSFESPNSIEWLKHQESVKFMCDSLTLDSSVDDIVDKVAKLYTDLVKISLQFHSVSNKWRTVDLVLRFPRPGLSEETPVDALIDGSLPHWIKGPRVMAERLWRSFQSRGSATLSLRPEDLYGNEEGRSGVLNRTQFVPIIQSMVLHFLAQNGDNVAARVENGCKFEARGTMTFPGETRLHSFSRGDDPSASFVTRGSVPCSFGLCQEASVLHKSAIDPMSGWGSAFGLSPFMDFDFNFSESKFPTEHDSSVGAESIREILVLFRLRCRDSSVNKTIYWMDSVPLDLPHR